MILVVTHTVHKKLITNLSKKQQHREGCKKCSLFSFYYSSAIERVVFDMIDYVSSAENECAQSFII